MHQVAVDACDFINETIEDRIAEAASDAAEDADEVSRGWPEDDDDDPWDVNGGVYLASVDEFFELHFPGVLESEDKDE
jgi:hypothetical protein